MDFIFSNGAFLVFVIGVICAVIVASKRKRKL